MKRNYFAIFAALLLGTAVQAQVGLGTTLPDGALDITSTNDGLLIPRIALVDTATATVLTPTESELVYNTATVNDVTPGYYYWSGGAWIRLQAGAKTGWELTGNAGTTPGTNFIGTTDNVNFRVKTNNADRFDFTNNGRLRAYDNGTVALPTYSWNGDTGTGFWRPAANTLAFSTNATERLRIASNGNVGIGATADASALLHLNATDRGMLIPNVVLTAMNVAAPVTTPATSLLVYNTNTTAGVNGVSPGFYYWGGSWIRLQAGGKTGWELLGNAGTTAANYVGTSDAQPLKLATNGAERVRVLANGQVVVNNTGAPFGGDRFSVYNTVTSDYAINGYATATGVGVYGQNAGGTGYGVYGLNNSTGIAVIGENTNTGAGVYGSTSGSTSAGVFGRADVAAGIGVYGTTNGAGGDAVNGYASGGGSNGVYGASVGNLGAGVYGVTNVANGSGAWGANLNASGTGLYGAGNNQAATYLTAGSGGAFTGNQGMIAYARLGTGTGVIGAGNNLGGNTITGGSGGAFNGTVWGAFANATTTGATATDRAAFVGNYNDGAARSVYVGARIGSTNYKILGTGGGSVSTTMPTRSGERILFAPEAPENWFFDIGEATLVDGKATVTLDPIFVDCISDAKPFKVFVQGAEETLGSIRVTRNQNGKTFTLEDMGGASNGIVQYSVYAIWKQKENLRFPEYHQPYQVQELQSEKMETRGIKKEKEATVKPAQAKKLAHN